MTDPVLSVVVASRGPPERIEPLVASLAKQTLAPDAFEVIVVAEGSIDAVRTPAGASKPPFRLEMVEQPSAGVAAARNAGARLAVGSILLFLAPDLEATDRLLESHVGAHREEPKALVVGPYPPARARRVGYHAMAVRSWWHDRFEAMRSPAHRFSFRDCLGGNLSVPTELFRRLGGFDPIFTDTHEDHDLGARALAAGAMIRFAPDALAYRVRPAWRLDEAFRRARSEGRADAMLGLKSPELRPALPAARFGMPTKLLARFGHDIAFSWPRLNEVGLRLLAAVLRGAERVQLRSRWRRLFEAGERQAYLRGLADVIGTRDALYRFVEEGPLAARVAPARELEIELADGVAEALQQVDRVRPTSARVRWRGNPIGTVTAPPGTEPLRGIHVQAVLVTELEWAMYLALVAEPAIGGDLVPVGSEG